MKKDKINKEPSKNMPMIVSIATSVVVIMLVIYVGFLFGGKGTYSASGTGSSSNNCTTYTSYYFFVNIGSTWVLKNEKKFGEDGTGTYPYLTGAPFTDTDEMIRNARIINSGKVALQKNGVVTDAAGKNWTLLDFYAKHRDSINNGLKYEDSNNQIRYITHIEWKDENGNDRSDFAEITNVTPVKLATASVIPNYEHINSNVVVGNNPPANGVIEFDINRSYAYSDFYSDGGTYETFRSDFTPFEDFGYKAYVSPALYFIQYEVCDELDEYTATFYDGDEEVDSDSCTVESGEDSCDVNASNEFKGDDGFLGWDENPNCTSRTKIRNGATITLDEDKEFYACWEDEPDVRQFTLTHHMNDGTKNDIYKVTTCSTENGGDSCGVNVYKTNPTREGYTFIEWNENKDCKSGTKYKANDPITLKNNKDIYACWKENDPDTVQWKLTYYMNDGTENVFNYDMCTVANGETNCKLPLIPDEPNRKNYKFIGWNDSKECKTDSMHKNSDVIVLDKNKQVYACWVEDTIPYSDNINADMCLGNKIVHVDKCQPAAKGALCLYDGGSAFRSDLKGVDACKVDDITPPKTGTAAVIIAWIIGIMAIGYTWYYFNKLGKENS